MKPVIGIPQLGPGLLRLYFRILYNRALSEAGAEVRWIGPENIGAVTQCDGLLIPGGDDIDPKFYGQRKSRLCGKQNPLRDRLDPALLKAFLPTGKPVLGICRGMQMLNVHLGGTLHQDIRSLQTVCHQSAHYSRPATHPVTIAADSLLGSILGKETLTVNTLHHQAVDAPGAGLLLCASSEDKIPEAIELPGHRFCLGVQWHPEMLSHRNADHRKILQAFVDACR